MYLAAALSMPALAGAIVAPARAEWTPPVQLSASGQGERIAVDGRGDAYAVWRECRSACFGSAVMAAYLPAGAAEWQPPVQISGEDAFGAQIGADAAGEAITIWNSHSGPGSAIRSLAGKWETTTLPGSGDYSQDAELAVDAAGDAVAAWEDGSRFYVSTRAAGSDHWSPSVAITTPGEQALDTRVAIGPDGSAAAIWTRHEPVTAPCSPPNPVPCQVIVAPGTSSVKAALRAPGGAWQTPVTLARTAAWVSEPRVVSARGDVTVLWLQNDGTTVSIQSARDLGVSGWEAPVRVTLAPNSAPAPGEAAGFTSPQLAVDGADDATAAWLLGGRVEIATRGAGGDWSSPAAIAVDEPYAGDLSLAGNASGAAVALWVCGAVYPGHRRQLPSELRGAVRPAAAASWLAARNVAPEGYAPQVAVGPEGRALAAWEQSGFGPMAVKPGVFTSIFERALAGPGVPQTSRCPRIELAPALSHVHMTRAHFRVAHTPTTTTARARRGSAFAFALDQRATVSVEIDRVLPGLRRSGPCQASSRTLKRSHARPCVFMVPVGNLTRHSEPAGSDQIAFSGRIGSQPLLPGLYDAALRAANGGGSSGAPVTVGFRILR